MYSLRGDTPKPLPNRIRLSDGSTRTDNTTFTVEEIADAGYVEVVVPDYNGLIEYLDWDGLSYTIRLLPPQPDWDNFNLTMMSNPRFNQVYNSCLSVAPLLAGALPTSLDQVTTKGTTLFNLVFNQICFIGGATVEDRLVWGAIAEDNNLPQEFIDILKG